MNHLESLVNEYLVYCRYQKGLDTKTLKAYTFDLKQFLEFTGDKDPSKKDTLNQFIMALHQNYQPKTSKRKIASLKAFYHYLEYEEILNSNPFNKILVKYREPKLLPKTIPFQTIEALLQTMYLERDAAPTTYQKEAILRDIAMIELLFATGVRISELCTLRQQNIDLVNHTLLIYGKGAKERLLQVANPNVHKILSEYYCVFEVKIKSSGWFFVNRLGKRYSEQCVRSMIKKYTRLAAISQHITPHMFRHSFATLLLEADVDIRYIQKMLGHSSITTTEIYTSVSMAKQKDILTVRHPRNQMDIKG